MERSELYRLAQAEAWAIWSRWLDACLANVQPMAERVEAADAPVSIIGEIDRQAAAGSRARAGRVARIPITGAISKRETFWSQFFGGTTVEGLTRALREVAADDTIGTVLFDVDSPGGTVGGIAGLAAEIRKVRDSKYVVAVANGTMASAAYWIGSQADEVIAAPDSIVGSVGVYMMHEDWSKVLEKAGIKVTYIYAGEYKVEGNPDEPLSDEARAHLQGLIDDAYGLFVGDVAKGRGVTVSEVKANYGKGRVLTAADAKAAGMIDRVAGINETLRRLTGAKAEALTQTLTQTLTPTLSQRPAVPPSKDGHGREGENQNEVGNSLAAKRLRLDLLEKIH
jgi:capsid assembly protease